MFDRIANFVSRIFGAATASPVLQLTARVLIASRLTSVRTAVLASGRSEATKADILAILAEVEREILAVIAADETPATPTEG